MFPQCFLLSLPKHPLAYGSIISVAVCLLCVLPSSFFCACLCSNFPLSRTLVLLGWEPILIWFASHPILTELRASAITLLPNKVTFWGSGVRVSIYILGDTTQPITDGIHVWEMYNFPQWKPLPVWLELNLRCVTSIFWAFNLYNNNKK